MEADLQKTLLMKAGTLLARRAYTRGEMKSKLSPLASQKEVDSALDRLEQLNLLNDAEYAYNFALCRIKEEGWGPIKVHHSLLRRHVAPLLVESAIDRVRQEISDSAALSEHLRRLCRKSGLPADLKGIRNLVLQLHRRGFHEDTIYSTLRRMIPADAWQAFETGE